MEPNMNVIQKKVEEEVKNIKDSYIRSVHRLNSDNGTASSFSKDYEGRQIYELLQNAEDQVNDNNGIVKITLKGNKLTVANTGEPFSDNGLISILYVCDSPKGHITSKTIGYKGIGFRSILNWTNEITIKSNGLQLEFSKENAQKAFEEIIKEVENKEDYLRDYKKTDGTKVPVLVCPKISEISKKEDIFDTVLEFSCFDSIIENVITQISELKPEVLLFLTKLKTIQFDINGEKKEFSRIDSGDGTIKEIIVNYYEKKNKEERIYNFFNETGDIDGKYYEISVGYDRNNKTSGEVLYSYFKTNVEISFPAFIHATFELSSNRNELLAGNLYNEKLTKLLAKKLAEVAVRISLLDSEDRIATYEPLELLLTNKIDIQYNFQQLLKQEIETAALFPTIKNEYISLQENPRYSDQDFDNVLNPSSFSTLLKKCDNNIILTYIKNEANLLFYENSNFKDLLNKDIKENLYTLEQKCELIQLINQNTNIGGEGITLLEDIHGNIISSDDNVYVQPSAKEKFEVPDWPWLRVSFLNDKMKNILLADIEQDEIDKTFRDFKLVRYRFNTLIGKIISDLNKTDKSIDKVKAVLSWLFNFYCTPKSETSDTGERDLGTTRIPIICRNNIIAFATDSYFGSEYGNNIGEKIVSSYDKNHFIAYEAFNCDEIQKVIRFYEWIGVSHYPRVIEINVDDIIDRKNYTNFNFESTSRTFLGQYSKTSFNYQYIKSLKLSFFENFETIIKNVEFYEIISWLLLDDNAQQRLQSTYEIDRSSVMSYKTPRSYEYSFDNDSLASFIKFFLTNKQWIKINGEFYDASHCCLEELKIKKIIASPKINISDIKQYCPSVTQTAIRDLLLKLGIAESFADIPTNIKYEFLLKLPELDPEYRYGKSIYNKMKGTADKVLMEKGPNYLKFLQEGEVLVSINGEKQYISVKKAKYTPNKLFSEKILNEFPMFVYDYRQGRVPELFGVELLGDIHPVLTDEHIDPRINEQFSNNFEDFKVYLLASRLVSNEADTDLRKLKRLNIILSDIVKVDFPINNETKSVTLDNYQTVYLNESDEKKNKVAYIKIPENISYRDLERNPYFADAVAEIVSTVLDLSGELAFFSSLFESSHERRKNLLINTKGEEVLEYIDIAKDKLKVQFNNKEEFWFSIANTKNKHFEDGATIDDIITMLQIDNSFISQIDYNHLNSISNIPVIIELFKKLQIDVENYNKQTSDCIYLKDYYRDKFEKLRIELKDKYLMYLYQEFKDNKNLEQYEYEKHSYLTNSIELSNSVNEDIEQKFSELFGIKPSELDIFGSSSVEEIILHKKNENKLYESLINLYPQEKLDLYLLFDRLEELQQENDKPKIEIKENQKKTLQEIIEEAKKLASNPEYDPNAQTEKVEFNSKPSGKHGHHKFGSGKKTSNLNDIREENGLAGEIAVYETLKKNYSTTVWVSENATKYGIPHSGDDSLGYDISYINENNEQMKVEVKATTGDEIEFDFSNNELATALEDPNHYEVFFVFLKKEGRPNTRVLNLGKLFKFDNENETPFSNSKFTIQYDKYVIRAKEKLKN